MTSANVVEYAIFKNDKQVGHFRKNVLCKLPEYNELLKYTPLNEFSIIAYGYDEEDEYWDDEVQNLETFLRRYILFDKVIREYFKNIDNA